MVVKIFFVTRNLVGTTLRFKDLVLKIDKFLTGAKSYLGFMQLQNGRKECKVIRNVHSVFASFCHEELLKGNFWMTMVGIKGFFPNYLNDRIFIYENDQLKCEVKTLSGKSSRL